MPSGSPGRLVWSDAHFAYRTGSAREDLSFDRRDNARGMPKAVVVDETFNWGRREIAAEHPLGRHHHLRSPRQGPDAEARRRAAESARHLWRPVLAGDDRASQAARRHHHRAVADPRLRRRPHAGRKEAGELLGLQHAVVLRAGAALRAGQSARRVPHHGGAAARCRHRGDARRRLQSHRRGQPHGPDAVVPRHRQRLLLLAEAGQSALSTTISPAAAIRSTSPIRACCRW